MRLVSLDIDNPICQAQILVFRHKISVEVIKKRG